MNTIKKITICLLLAPLTFAAETDGFTSRYQSIKDGLPAINKEINNKIESVIIKMNHQSDSKSCDFDKLNSLLGDQLRQPFLGQIENFIMNSSEVDKSNVDFNHSILRNVSTFHHSVIRLGILLGIGYAPSIKHKGLLIGADKFGHFMDEGYYYYKLVHHWNYSLEEVIKFGEYIEFYIEGKTTGGIYSYADLSANYDGYRFWLHLLGSEKEKIKSKYFTCDNGRWSQNSRIDLDHYVSSSWDEGMNCNDYISDTMRKDIDRTIRKLEIKNKKRYRCPVYPEKITAMINKYGKFAKNVINPKLFNQASNN